MSWACPRCDRTFRQVHQRHACGVGSAATLFKGRPPALTDLYRKLETTVKNFGDVEVVTRDRYALFRTTRIFADLTVMRDALRVVIHLARKAGTVSEKSITRQQDEQEKSKLKDPAFRAAKDGAPKFFLTCQGWATRPAVVIKFLSRGTKES